MRSLEIAREGYSGTQIAFVHTGSWKIWVQDYEKAEVQCKLSELRFVFQFQFQFNSAKRYVNFRRIYSHISRVLVPPYYLPGQEGY